jgi:hypothetical protein
MIPAVGDIPVTCPHCGAFTRWTTTGPWVLTVNDQAFLKRRGIATAPEDTIRSASSKCSG